MFDRCNKRAHNTHAKKEPGTNRALKVAGTIDLQAEAHQSHPYYYKNRANLKNEDLPYVPEV